MNDHWTSGVRGACMFSPWPPVYLLRVVQIWKDDICLSLLKKGSCILHWHFISGVIRVHVHPIYLCIPTSPWEGKKIIVWTLDRMYLCYNGGGYAKKWIGQLPVELFANVCSKYLILCNEFVLDWCPSNTWFLFTARLRVELYSYSVWLVLHFCSCQIRPPVLPVAIRYQITWSDPKIN